MAYISCENLLLGYEGTPIAEPISFEVNRGDYLCVLGENGAGKSTLIKTLLHLTPPLGGRVVTGEGLQPFEIGYLPQQTVAWKDFPASVWEIVLSGALSKCGRRPFFGKEEKKLAEANLRKMDIYDLKDACYRDLSGGQQQRVLLARALCATSKLILLDEPVAGLDPKAVAEFYGRIRELNKEGTAVIMVSHDMKAALTDASHILHIEKEQSFYGTKKEYKKSEAFQMFRDTEV